MAHYNKLLLCIVILSITTGAQSAQSAQWENEFYNPKPIAGEEPDVILPMPCDGAMAFRKVSVLSKNALHDEKIRLGRSSTETGYSDFSRDAYIAGAFSGENNVTRYYLMGKYEVTALQYKAVMDETCPAISSTLNIPAARFSWFDAVSFSDRYTRWLLKNKKNILPKEGDYSGYLRLPTEEEWEFAARGGNKVTSGDFVDTLYPMDNNAVQRYEWFSGVESNASGDKPRAIGQLLPNPLGLHDMLGNVQEMMLEPYRLRKFNRDHGSSGGYVLRGGNVLTSKADLRSAARSEKPYYRRGKPSVSSLAGMRLVIAAPVLNSRGALLEIEKEWLRMNEGSGDEAMDDLQEISRNTVDVKTKKQLDEVSAKFAAERQKSNELQMIAARGALKLGGFLCSRLGEKSAVMNASREALDSCMADDEEAYCRDIFDPDGLIASNEENLLGFAGYYADNMEETRALYKQNVLDEQQPLLEQTLKETGYQALVPYVQKFSSHMHVYRDTGAVKRERWMHDCETLWKAEE